MKPVLKRLIAFAFLMVSATACAGGARNTDGILTETLYQAALEAERNTDYAAAANHYLKLLEKKPNDKAALLGMARNLRYAGSAADAARVLEQRRSLFLQDPAFVIELAKAKLAGGKTTAAIGYFQEARKMDPKNWTVPSALGIAYDMAQDFEAAEKSYKKALALSPDNPVVMNNLAISIAQTGRLDEAIDILGKAAVLSRKSAQIRQNLALLHGIKGDFKKAEALARMDLDNESVSYNLSFFQRFHEKGRGEK
ncbi:MAG TPA: tetratricopeptide repeat protein [Rhodospirillales bacterium]|nr:tetratricopeptide repeat protein [Rhodospirillales bacterium]